MAQKVATLLSEDSGTPVTRARSVVAATVQQTNQTEEKEKEQEDQTAEDRQPAEERPVNEGGYRPEDGLRARRFLTLEDTVIRVSDVLADLGDLTIDASSRTDGGDTVVLDQQGLELAIYGTRPLMSGTTVDTASTDLVLHKEEAPASEASSEEDGGAAAEDAADDAADDAAAQE